MNSLLARLAKDDFADSIGVILPPAPLRRVIQRSPEVRRLGEALRYGQITPREIREFAHGLLSEFRSGEIFKYDIVLAAIAVAMEHWGNSFAEEYLLDLARLQRPEFRASFRIARECLNARRAFPRTEIRTAKYPHGQTDIRRSMRPISELSPPSREARRVKVPWVHYSELCNA